MASNNNRIRTTVRAAISSFRVEAAVKDKFNRDSMGEVLLEAISSQDAEPYPEANVQEVLKCFKELLSVQSLRLGSLSENELKQLLEVCARLSLTAPRFAVEINVGFGGSPHEVQVRTPVYLVPGLELLAVFHRFYKRGVLRQMPTLRVIDATKIALEVNRSFDVEKTTLHGCARMEVLRAFIDRFVPADLHQHVLFVSDKDLPYPDDPSAMTLLHSALNSDEQLASEYQHMLATNGRRVGRQNDEKKHGGDDNSAGSVDAALQVAVARYVTAHPFIFRDLVVTAASEVPTATISIGGAAEERFNRFRRVLQDLVKREPLLLSSSGPIRSPQFAVRLVSKIGSNPPYYATDGDVPLWTLQGDGVDLGPVFGRQVDASKRSQIAADYQALLRYTGGAAAYRGFCAEWAPLLATRPVRLP